MRRLPDRVLALGFCAALALPLLCWRLDPAAWRAVERENRYPAAFPRLALEHDLLYGFPRGFEAWHADTFGLREPLLALHGLAALRLWNKVPHPRLLMGREGWIFYTDDHSREVWRGRYEVPSGFVANGIAALRSREAWFARRGIAYLLVIAPNKETVYPEMLPPGEERVGPTPLELFARELARDPSLPLLDLGPALAAERAHDDPEAQDWLYHPHGTHWTERAGWCAAEAIAARLRELHPGLADAGHRPREGCVSEEVDAPGEDTWAQSLGLERFYRQRVHSFRERAPRARLRELAEEDLWLREGSYQSSDGAGPAMLLLHDSFGPWLRPHLAQHASRLLALWTEDPPLDRIAAEAPRVCVEVRTERRLLRPLEWLEDAPEPLAPAVFAALAPLELEPGAPDGLAGVEPFQEARLAPEPARPGSLRLDAVPGGERVLLPRWRFRAGERLALRVVLVNSAPATAFFWYQTPVEPEYHARRRYSQRLGAGRNELLLVFPAGDLAGRILFQPGAAGTSTILESVEARSLAR